MTPATLASTKQHWVPILKQNEDSYANRVGKGTHRAIDSCSTFLAESATQGNTVLEMEPAGLAAKEINDLAGAITAQQERIAA
jgi:hypothetical protein